MEKLNSMKPYQIILLLLIVVAASFSKSKLLVIRTAGANFEEAKSGIAYDLEYDFDIVDMIIDKTTLVEEISAKMSSEAPAAVVLMNNRSISLFKKYQATMPEGTKAVPSVSLMGILVDDMIDGMQNAYGIEYEIPIVTSAVNLRTIMGKDKVKKVGIVHRANLGSFIEENRNYCKNEGISLETIEIGSNNVEKDLQKALKTLVKEHSVDVIWVPVDNKLVNKNLLINVWIPFQKKNTMSIVVGVNTLVNPKFHFGTFAVLPDHVALGSQAASVIYDIMDNNWEVEDNGAAQPPLSVYTILNYPDNKAYFGLAKESLMGVDKILE